MHLDERSNDANEQHGIDVAGAACIRDGEHDALALAVRAKVDRPALVNHAAARTEVGATARAAGAEVGYGLGFGHGLRRRRVRS